MSVQYLLIQGIGFIGIALYLLSFQCKTNRALFAMQTASYLFYSLNFLLLGAVTGAANTLISLVRSACLASKYKWANGKLMCVLLCLASVVFTFVTWQGWISILPSLGTIASTIGGYSHNPRSVRTSNMFFNCPLYLIYDIIVGSWAGIIDELSTETSIIISIIRYGWKNLDKQEQ